MAKKKTPTPAPAPPPEPSPAEILRNAPQDELEELLSDPVRLEQVRLLALQAIAQQGDDPVGFSAFYELIHGNRLPKHAEKEWIEPVYQAKENGRGVVIEAFRGSTKTTTLTNTFTAWRMGKEPHRANLLIQVGDDIAQDNTAQIADIIANNPGWKLCFPHVVPDRDRGWGAGGYEVKRADMDYTRWRELCSRRKDPSLVGVGYKSREVIGKHPDGILVVDDICDENNTSSERELATLRTILTGTIFPTMTPETWAIFVGTPWVENDVLAYAASTGMFDHIKTPVMRDGVPVWPQKFSLEAIDKQRRLAGSLQFARMFLLDLTAANNRVFKYMAYPSTNIKASWPIVGGVDYAGTWNVTRNKEAVNDYFALAYVAKLPGGGAVVYDGVLARCTQGEAEGYVNRAQEIFPMWQTCVVEGDGKGEEFFQVIRRNPNLKLLPMKTGGKGKAARLERQMGPWLENGTVRISDADTPFLNELRHELDTYPHCDHDDALDAVYWALRGIPDVLTLPRAEDEIPEARRKKKEPHPFIGFGSESRQRYGERF